MSILKLEDSIIVNSIVQKLESTLKEFDVTFVCKNGRKSVTKLLLACWSTFWKDLLLELDNQNEITIILPDVENTVLEKVLSSDWDWAWAWAWDWVLGLGTGIGE